ncbi:MAG: hypothetical protein HZA14_05550 [Nitrospirae bacterium]|nr:hypothetical protein [Nitrospirota bacterium]
MKTLIIILLFTALLSSFAFAGEIYGTIKKGGKPVGGETANVKCNNFSGSVKTDAYGSYTLHVPVAGECKITVGGSSIGIYSFESAARYNLILENNGTLRME